ncbi:MAG: hypothetical protein [Caudoviricetes sp.]|nr:MAG: hypothetical protein [Caudoviricetes sp.]
MKYFSFSCSISIPAFFPNITVSLTSTDNGIRLPESHTPSPTANTTPSWGLFSAVSGIIIPPTDLVGIVFFLTTILSFKGLIFIISFSIF